MSRLESIVVGFVTGILSPLSLFVLCWWTTAALVSYHVLPIPDSGIAVAAFTGLAMGVVLDVLRLKNWIAKFYTVDVKLMVLAYLFWSTIAVAFFMGLPFGNIALGTLAGVYVGRRQYHTGESGQSFPKAARNVGIFTALVTGAEALPIGLLTLDERRIMGLLEAVVGLDQSVTTGPIGIGLVGLVCVVLMVVQFWCTRTAAWLAFGLGRAGGA